MSTYFCHDLQLRKERQIRRRRQAVETRFSTHLWRKYISSLREAMRRGAQALCHDRKELEIWQAVETRFSTHLCRKDFALSGPEGQEEGAHEELVPVAALRETLREAMRRGAEALVANSDHRLPPVVSLPFSLHSRKHQVLIPQSADSLVERNCLF